MTDWTHPTLADTGATQRVVCRCNRPRNPSEMYDVRDLPGTEGAEYLCAACLEDLHRADALDRLTLHAAKGAPPEWVEAFEAKLLEGPLLRTGLPPEIWGAKLAAELDALAAEEAARDAETPEPS
jgi:hypothetical protein